jgi:hypothetical protein
VEAYGHRPVMQLCLLRLETTLSISERLALQAREVRLPRAVVPTASRLQAVKTGETAGVRLSVINARSRTCAASQP